MSINYRLALLLAALGWAAHALAQPGPGNWVNRDLRAKNMPAAQYEAISRGAFAQCRANATVTLEGSMPPPPSCAAVSRPEEVYPCESARERRIEARKRAFQDLILGCMAKEGWLWESP